MAIPMPPPPPAVPSQVCSSSDEASTPQERNFSLQLKNGQSAHFTSNMKVQVYCPKKPVTKISPPIKIEVHGYSACGAFMGRLARQWQASGFRVYQLNLLGHCGSGAPEKENFDYQDPMAYADSIINFMDASGIAKAHFDCHSMGGVICQALASQFPSRVASLTLITPWEWPVTLSKAFNFFGPDIVDAVLGSPKLLLKRMASAAAKSQQKALREDPEMIAMTQMASPYWKQLEIPILFLTSQIRSDQVIQSLVEGQGKPPPFPVVILLGSEDKITPLEQGLFACYAYDQDCYVATGGHQLPFEISETIHSLSLKMMQGEKASPEFLRRKGILFVPKKIVAQLVTAAGLPPKAGKSVSSLSKKRITMAKLRKALETASDSPKI